MIASDTRLLEGKTLAATIRTEVAAEVRDLIEKGGRPPGLTAVLVGEDPASQVWLDQRGFVPATPLGIIELLKRNGLPIAGRRAVVVGRSAIVGKPMAGLLLRENATVTICHSRTADLATVTREADILIVAIGRTAMIGPEHVREGAVVIDVGMNRVTDPAEAERLFPGDEARRRQFESKGSFLTGDVDFTRVAPIASAITPVPGGVGLLTVALLLVNTLEASRLRQGLPPAGGQR
jgi:methylenetetrahydrofolate dehydrogenase (NADP+)/methenyltetrahydrofolate cyclohydrolase